MQVVDQSGVIGSDLNEEYAESGPPNGTSTFPTRPTLFLVKEVADILRCHPSTIYEMLDRGQLRGIRIGKCKGGIRILASSVDDLLASGGRELSTGEKTSQWSPPTQCKQEPILPLPPKSEKPKVSGELNRRSPKPGRPKRWKSHEALPYPCRNRSTTPATSPSVQTGGCNGV